MASVAEIDGLTISGGAPAVPSPAAAYSVRLLDSAVGISSYTGAAMRVRRETAGGTGDDDEADIAFDSGVISLDSAISNASALVTATTLGQFLNVGTVNGTTYTNPDSLTVTASCFVDEWKDQSGNANHAEQTTNGSQPQIHSGTVNTDLILENGKPALSTNGSQYLTYSTISFASDLCFVNVQTAQVSDAGYGGTSGNFGSYFVTTTRMRWRFTGSDSDLLNFPAATAGDQYTSFANRASGTMTMYYNGVTYGSPSTNTGTATFTQLMAGNGTGSLGLDGNSQEIIFWDSDQSSNRTGIETNINSDYLIYQPTDQPTSGLLYDYGSATGGTDAAAAYSVRQLSDKAVICMRIRRDMGAGNPGDDDETNIGFDANGDLDTQAISDFCGTGTGFVTRWWDQSVNGNHLDQPVGGTGSNSLQPQIYNGTAVITENGKPALSFDGVLDQFPIDNTGLDIGNLSVFIVTKHNTTSQTSIVLSMSGGTSPTNKRWYVGYQDLGDFNFGYASVSKAVSTTATTDQQLSTMIAGTTQGNMSAFIDGSLIGTATRDTGISSDQQAALGTFNNQFYANAKVQEFIYWSADQSTNRTGIETNVMTHFNIP